MKTRTKGVFGAAACLAVAAGAAALLAPAEAQARRPRNPPCPNCQPTIELAPGIVCTLVDCGFDCVYVCPFPFP